MKQLFVKDIMLSLTDVPTIRDDRTLAEAVCALKDAQHRRPAGRLPFRVILVVNAQHHVVGKLGHLAFIQALEPGYEPPEEREALRRAGVDPALVDSLSQYRRLWEGDLAFACQRAAHLRVGDVMRCVGESVTEDVPLLDAISTLLRLGTLSVLVRRDDKAVGLLRLADVYDVAAELMVQERDEVSNGPA